MGLPTDATYVTWKPTNGYDIAAWARTLPSSAVMVIPKSYGPVVEFDSSKGFRASDTTAMEYISDADYLTKGLASDGKPYGTKHVTGMTPVEPTTRHRFSMMRVPRGIVTLGGQDLAPTISSYGGQRQPKTSMGVYDRRDTQVPARLFLHVGVQQKLIETAHASPIYANFTLKSQDLGAIAYSGLAAGAAGGKSTSVGCISTDAGQVSPASRTVRRAGSRRRGRTTGKTCCSPPTRRIRPRRSCGTVRRAAR